MGFLVCLWRVFFAGGRVGFRVRHGLKSWVHSEGAEGRKGGKRPAGALSSVASPGGARYVAASGGGLWEPWGAAGDWGGSEGRAGVPNPPSPTLPSAQALTCEDEDLHHVQGLEEPGKKAELNVRLGSLVPSR